MIATDALRLAAPWRLPLGVPTKFTLLHMAVIRPVHISRSLPFATAPSLIDDMAETGLGPTYLDQLQVSSAENRIARTPLVGLYNLTAINVHSHQHLTARESITSAQTV